METSIEAVRSYWETHPLCASAVPYTPGTREFYDCYDRLREENESVEFSYRVQEYAAFRGKSVLDVGCGNGYVLQRYASEGADVTGIDLTAAAVFLSRQRFELAGLSGEFLEANAERLPFGDNQFDCVCSMGVLHHTPDPPKAVREIHRVLKPGGRLIVMFYHRGSAYYQGYLRLSRLLTGKSLQQLVNEFDGVGNPKGWAYSRAQLRELLRGFRDLQMLTHYLRGSMVLPRLGRAIPPAWLRPFESRWGWYLYAKGYKAAGSAA